MASRQQLLGLNRLPSLDGTAWRTRRRQGRERPMDQRIESFLTVVLAHRRRPECCPGRLRIALADCEAIFRAREDNERMKDQAARACRALCRTRGDEAT